MFTQEKKQNIKICQSGYWLKKHDKTADNISIQLNSPELLFFFIYYFALVIKEKL